MTSIRDPKLRYDSIGQALAFVGQEWLKRVRTAMPATIVAYTPSTGRARVQPAVDITMSDGTFRPRPQIPDVPVLQPAGGGYLLSIPLQAGDPVLLIYSHRDIGAFKRSLQPGPSEGPNVLWESDCIAVPGFAPLATSRLDGLALQSTDGQRRIEINDGGIDITDGSAQVNIVPGSITMALGSSSITISAAGVAIAGGAVTVNGVAVADASAGTGSTDGHTHTLTGA